MEGLDGIKRFHVDILIYGCRDNDKEAHDDHDRKLDALLQRVFERNIKLNKDKIKLEVDSLMYLKFVISKNGLCIDPQKVREIQAMQQPRTATSRDGKLCSTILTQPSEITAV